jgi:hypothetical protein
MDLAFNFEKEEADQSETTPRDNTDRSQQEVVRADTASPENPSATTHVHDYQTCGDRLLIEIDLIV